MTFNTCEQSPVAESSSCNATYDSRLSGEHHGTDKNTMHDDNDNEAAGAAGARDSASVIPLIPVITLRPTTQYSAASATFIVAAPSETRKHGRINPRVNSKIDALSINTRGITRYALESRTHATHQQLEALAWQTVLTESQPLYCRKTGLPLGNVSGAALATMTLASDTGTVMHTRWLNQFTHPAWLTTSTAILETLQLMQPAAFATYTLTKLFYADTLSATERHAILSQIDAAPLSLQVELAESLRRIATLLGKHVSSTLTFASHRRAEEQELLSRRTGDIELRAAVIALAAMPERDVRLFNLSSAADSVTRREIIDAAHHYAESSYIVHCDSLRRANADIDAQLAAIYAQRIAPFNLQYTDLAALLSDLYRFFTMTVRELFMRRRQSQLDKIMATRGKTISVSDVLAMHVNLGLPEFSRGNKSRRYDDKLLSELHDMFISDDGWNTALAPQHGAATAKLTHSLSQPLIDLDADEPSDDDLMALEDSDNADNVDTDTIIAPVIPRTPAARTATINAALRVAGSTLTVNVPHRVSGGFKLQSAPAAPAASNEGSI